MCGCVFVSLPTYPAVSTNLAWYTARGAKYASSSWRLIEAAMLQQRAEGGFGGSGRPSAGCSAGLFQVERHNTSREAGTPQAQAQGLFSSRGPARHRCCVAPTAAAAVERRMLARLGRETLSRVQPPACLRLSGMPAHLLTELLEIRLVRRFGRDRLLRLLDLPLLLLLTMLQFTIPCHV